MKTMSAKAETAQRQWYVINAANQVLGRLATEVAKRLRGKHKPLFTPHVDMGDYVIVINADQIKVTGRKPTQKKYYRHSGYTGNLKTATFLEMKQKNPVYVIEQAVKGMLPRGPLGRQLFRKLKVYKRGDHPHLAQQPQMITIE